MPRQLTTDQLLRLTAGLLLGLLLWQGDRICTKVDTLDTRLDALEVSQGRILAHLDIPPAAVDTLDFRVKSPLAAAWERINEIKPPEDTPKIVEFFP